MALVSKTLGDWFVPSEIDELVLQLQPGDMLRVINEKGVYLVRKKQTIPLLTLVLPSPEPKEKKKTRRGRRRRTR